METILYRVLLIHLYCAKTKSECIYGYCKTIIPISTIEEMFHLMKHSVEMHTVCTAMYAIFLIYVQRHTFHAFLL